MAKTRVLLDGMERMGYAAVNVGERDIRTGYDDFVERVGDRAFGFLSANIVRADSEQPVFQPSTVLEARAARGDARVRVGVIGVARFNPLFRRPGPAGSELKIVHPKPIIEREVERLQQQQVDLIVLLAAVHSQDISRIVADIPAIDFVLGSYGGFFTTNRDRSGRAWILYSGNQGQRLGETRVFLRQGENIDHITRLHLLTEVYPSNDAMLRLVDSVADIAAVELPAVTAGHSGGQTSGQFVGTRACGNCHARELTQWQSTAHARALTTLETAGKDGAAACLTCHTTAAGRPGGFRSRQSTPQLAAVGCESCHGPGATHVLDTAAPYGKVETASCTVCHDNRNSPKFDFYDYVPKVDHQR